MPKCLQAIEGAADALELLRTRQGESGQSLDIETIEKQLYFLHSRIVSEGGLYHPKLAALAIKQSLGDTLEASFALRAYRSTKPRLLETPLHDTTQMRLIRRISASFKDIPGGQMLGPTTDYALRLLRMELLNGEHAKPGEAELSNFFEFFIIRCPKAGMPASKRLFQFAVEYPCPHL